MSYICIYITDMWNVEAKILTKFRNLIIEVVERVAGFGKSKRVLPRHLKRVVPLKNRRKDGIILSFNEAAWSTLGYLSCLFVFSVRLKCSWCKREGEKGRIQSSSFIWCPAATRAIPRHQRSVCRDCGVQCTPLRAGMSHGGGQSAHPAFLESACHCFG